MKLSLQQLLKPVSQDEAYDLLLRLATDLGFPVTSWHSGGVGRTLLRVFARPYSDVTKLISGIASGGYLDLANGAWLTLLARSVYRVERKQATFCEGKERLTCSPNAGPYSIQAGDLWFVSQNGKRFVNTSSGTIQPGESILVDIRAESPGSSYAVGAGTITEMVTPLAGVTSTNPDLGAGASWMTQAGTDEESDDSLRERCRLKWATLAAHATVGSYLYWAHEASDQVVRVAVDDGNPDGPGSLRVYLAGSSGGVLPVVVDEVDTYIQPRKAKTSIVSTHSASAYNVTVKGTVYVRSAMLSQANSQIIDNLDRFFQELEMGGEVVPPVTTGMIYRNKILGEITGVEGVVNASLISPSADLPMAKYQVATWGNELTIVGV